MANLTTITDKLNYLLDTKKLLKESIMGQGVYMGKYTPFRKYADKVNDIIPIITFVDYDGQILYQYTINQINSMENLPVPSINHQGLVFDGWNYTIEQIKDYNCPLIVGAQYYPESEKLEYHINIQQSNTTITIPTKGSDVDWGDNTETDNSNTHTYVNSGNYIIRVSGNLIGNTDQPEINTYIEKVYFPKSCTQIPVFSMCNSTCLKSVVIPTSVQTINYSAFYKCNLNCIVIPSSVITLDSFCFGRISLLNTISMPPSVQTIKDQVFYYNDSLEEVFLPNSVSDLTTFTFSNSSNLYKVTISTSLSELCYGMFNQCESLYEIIIPDSVSSIGSGCFNKCTSLKEISIPESVITISEHAFSECYNLLSISLSEGLEQIKNNAFWKNYALRQITIPSTVTTIGTYVFSYCDSLEMITVNAITPPLIGTDSIPSTCKIYVPSQSVELYKQQWNAYSSQIVAIE